MATSKNQAAQMPKAETVVVTARTPEQQAEIDKLRAEKVKAAQKAVEKTEQHPASMIDESTLKFIGYLKSIITPPEGEPISWKRKLAAFFATIVLSAGAGYAIGTLASYAMIGCLALTGSMFLFYLIGLIALILCCYTGAKIGEHVGNYILSGQIDRDFGRAKAKVTGWFTRKPKTVAAPAPAAA